ncbi:MAG: HEAT repeat domain-containing protein, partial [bacterium]|nr:HEAT repeat domain-containing protein [bacterium]
ILEYGKISELKNIKAKFEEMSKEMDASVMIYSNVVLLKMGNESSIYIIENAAKNSDPDIRKYAAYTLKFLDKKHKDRIYEILKNDQDPIVKILAITYYNAR